MAKQLVLLPSGGMVTKWLEKLVVQSMIKTLAVAETFTLFRTASDTHSVNPAVNDYTGFYSEEGEKQGKDL